MEYLLENILNMVGFLVGLCIGLASYLGYKNTGSPVLFRMSVAFLSIAIGFFVIWMGYVAEDLILQQGHIDRFVQTLGIARNGNERDEARHVHGRSPQGSQKTGKNIRGSTERRR